ncbi:MAG: efflux RND transporter permease subunit [Rhodospirillaceae bacterium]|jgi:multidrug efflux pump subunit AcrB|nr:efflux RND transporter permease subunit [Rhodospirillaceae bacterium]MBT6090124.1 efflux RND transporter permease subunit [Rhodospirillaceae bacterium]
MTLAEWSIKNPLLCCIAMLIAIVGGWLAFENMSRFEDPEFTIRIAKVITQYPGASPEEVMNEVTEPLETALQQLPEVKSVESISSSGLSDISVEIRFEYSPTKSDLQVVWTKVRNKINDAQSDLPPGARTSVVNDDFGDVYGVYYLLTGEGFSSTELESYAKTLRRDLLLVDGVAKVGVIGEQEEVIYIEIARDRAASLGVSLNQIYDTLDDQNTVAAAGDLLLGDERVEIHPTGAINTVNAIKGLIVGGANGSSITRLGAIATVTRGYREPVTKYVRYDGEPALGIGISNLSGVNVVKMGEDIESKLAELESQRPVGMTLHEYYHQGKEVGKSIQAFAQNVFTALVIVFVTLLIFMGPRSGLVMGATVLLTMAATLLIMWVAGIPMHRISLGALVISLGMLVDNGVVITDGILVGVQNGRKKLDVTREVAKKNWKPLLGGTLVGIIAFAPIGFAPGDTAEFTSSIFWVVLIALGLSWVLAFTFTPLFCYWAFPESADNASDVIREDSHFMRLYKNLIRTVLSHKTLALGAAVGVFVLAVFGFRFVQSGFFPASASPQIAINYLLPEGTDIERTKLDLLRFENYVRGVEGVEHVHTVVGGGTLRYMLTYDAGSNNAADGQILVRTSSHQENDRLVREIQAYADEAFPDAQTKVWKFRLGPGGGAKIEASFSGPDPKILRQLANQAKEIMARDGNAILIKDDWRRPVPVLEPVYSESKGGRVGITRKDVAVALEENFSGRQRSVYREGDKLIPVISRAPAAEKANAMSMPTIQIVSPTTQQSVPLVQVMDNIGIRWRDGKLLRSDRVLTIKAQCDPALGVLASDLQNRIKPQIDAIILPEGYKLKWEGEAGDSSEASGSLASTIPLGFLAMVLVVVILFNAVRQPIVVWSIVPLAIVGVVVGLVITQTPLEFMGIIGLLALSGLLIQNSLVLVDSIDEMIASGVPRFDALVDSAASRLRPVTMGAFTTVLGILPLYFDVFFKSMTVVLAFGLSFATLITLLVTPVLYALLFRISNDETARPSHGAEPTLEQARPA